MSKSSSRGGKAAQASGTSTRPTRTAHDSDSDGGEGKENAEDDGLLPLDVSPSHYALAIRPCHTDWTFRATLRVSLHVTAETDQIQFNAAELDIASAELATSAQGTLTPTRILHDEEEEVTTLRFDEALQVGEATLTLVYSGRISGGMNGLYRSTYKHAGREHNILVTQFEACDARRCLPCWDEPARKATFALTITHPSALTALANMPVRASKQLAPDAGDSDGTTWTETTFDTTPVMSSYLLAFVVGEFESIQCSAKSGTLVRVLTPLGKIDQAAFALDLARRCLDFYEDFFDLPFPLPKLDLVCVPDIAIIAMENWGLCTFGETALLVHPRDGSQAAKQYVALLVAHELSHQWFGNIVTMEWWTDLWLNEGFASWMEYFCVDALFPSWQMWSQYLPVHYTYSLSADAVANSHPVEVPVESPEDIDEIFDGISYSKGSTLIRMLHAYLGPDEFRKGVSAYLKKYSYKNACTADLWATLSESSGKDVARMMSQWSLQTGFPLVVVRGIKHSAGVVSVELTQRHFLLQGAQDKEDTKWTLPITGVAAGGGEASEPQLLTEHAGKIDFALSSASAASSSASASASPAFKLNAGCVYLYRVLYPLSHYSVLRGALPSFCPDDRLGLQNDLFAVHRAGAISFAILADFVEAYSAFETSATVWLDLSQNIQELGSALKHSGDVYTKYCAWVCALYLPVLARVGWDSAAPEEDHLLSLLRGRVVAMLVSHGEQAVARECCRRFHEFIATEATAKAGEKLTLGQAEAASSASSVSLSKASPSGGLLAPDIREGVYAAVVAHGGMLGYEIMLGRFRALTAAGGSREEIVRCLHALGNAPTKQQLADALNLALDECRTEDASGLIAAVAWNPIGAHVTWDFLKRRWQDVVDAFEGAFCLPRVVGLTAQFSTDAAAAEVQAFFKKNPAPTAERAVKQTIERIQSNAKLLKRDEKAIGTWLATRLSQMRLASLQISNK